ncbi:MAG: NAD(P)H nitroreductase [Mycobacterium sp.]|nr:NAD(P)H nitroreductase [Mycobacterium sp.]
MGPHIPGTDTLMTAMALAARAPSVHNIQPWRWHVGKQSVHLYADPSRQLAQADPDGRELIVSCGAALNHCVVALAALGWKSEIHRFPNPADPTHLASVDLHAHAAGEVDITLAAAITKRRTDRRRFADLPVALGDIALMGARAARMGVTVRRFDPTTTLRAILAQAVWQHAHDEDYVAELTAWSGRHASDEGVPARNTPESDPTARIPARIYAGTALAQPPGSGDDGGVLFALGTAGDQQLDHLRAGEATSLVLLTATALGLASCPVTEPLEIGETRAAVRFDAFDDEMFPQMLIRVGWAHIGADPLPPTPRRPLSETVTMLDGGPVD